MANQRSKRMIDLALYAASTIEDKLIRDKRWPSARELDSLVYDHEDMLFCWPCSIGWHWEKGKKTIDYHGDGLAILTRHRLLIVGKEDRSIYTPIEIELELSNVNWIELRSPKLVVVNAKRTLENDPPNPPNSQSDWKPYKKNPHLPFVGYSLVFQENGMGTLFYEKLKILPYSFTASVWPDLNLPLTIQTMELPLHPDMMVLNQLVIGYDALYTLADWILAGELGFSVGKLTNLLVAGDKILFVAKGKVYGASWTRDISFILITEKFLLLLNERGDLAHIAIGVNSIDQVSYKPSTFSRVFHRVAAEIIFEGEKFEIRFQDWEDKRYTYPFLGAMRSVGLGERLSHDIGNPHLLELDVLQPFEMVFTSEMEESAAKEDEAEDQSKAGYVYILMNPQYAPDLLKIGKTTRKPEDRAQEIYSTGVPGEFIVAYEEQVKDCSAAESEIHSRLAIYRVSNNREFFRIPLKDAVRTVSNVALKVGVIND